MDGGGKTAQLFSRRTWIAIAIIGVAGFVFLLQNHTSHIFTIVPYLILLLCPFMHIFMHRGHGEHGENSRGQHDHERHNP